MVDYVEDNKIRVAEKDIRIYLGVCDKKIKKYKKVDLIFWKNYTEKVKNIISIKGSMGVKVNKDNLSKTVGSLIFGQEQENIVNRYNGKKEKKMFYKVTLEIAEGLVIDDISEFQFAPLTESKKMDIDSKENILSVSDNELEFYLGELDLYLQRYDQVILTSSIENVENLKYMIRILNPQGIEIDDDYIDRKNKKIYFHSVEKEILNSRTGRKERKTFYRIGITKVPDLFMYTDENNITEVQ